MVRPAPLPLAYQITHRAVPAPAHGLCANQLSHAWDHVHPKVWSGMNWPRATAYLRCKSCFSERMPCGGHRGARERELGTGGRLQRGCSPEASRSGLGDVFNRDTFVLRVTATRDHSPSARWLQLYMATDHLRLESVQVAGGRSEDIPEDST